MNHDAAERSLHECDPKEFRRIPECDLLHKPLNKMSDQWDKLKVWAVVAIIAMVVSSAFNFYGTRKNGYADDLSIQRHISTTNCNALRSVLLKLGENPPNCEFERAK